MTLSLVWHCWLHRRRLEVALVLGLAAGCGTTRMTDTQRTATEQLLVSNAIDQAVSELNFQALAGKTVFFDPQFLDGAVDRGYLVSSMRQQLLACGCILQEERTKADYIVEARSGGVGTDRHAVLVGIPQMNVPTFMPGQPSQIPEIPFAKKTDQEGVAKIAVFAYNRVTGKPVWQSGLVQSQSTSKDMWLLGAGPFQRGTIRSGTEFAGEPLSLFPEKDEDESLLAPIPLTRSATWPEMPSPKADSKRLAALLGAVPLSERPGFSKNNLLELLPPLAAGPETKSPATNPSPPPARPADKAAASPKPPPPTPNAGGQAESEPCKVLTTGLGMPAGNAGESEPSTVLESNMGFKPEN